jgi:hypothetical protein
MGDTDVSSSFEEIEAAEEFETVSTHVTGLVLIWTTSSGLQRKMSAAV